MKTRLALVVAALVLGGGAACRKKSSVPAPVAPPPEAPAPVSEGGAPVAGNAAEMAASNAAVLTMMLQEFMAQQKRVPSTVKELEIIKTYGPLPPPPPGYRYVIDANRKQVLAVK